MGTCGRTFPGGYIAKLIPEKRLILVIREELAPAAAAVGDLAEVLFEGRLETCGLKAVTAGRGTIFFADVPAIGEIVLRPYRHGGLFGRIQGGYFPSPRRFLRELTLTEAARRAGITRLEPVGIAYRRGVRGVRGLWISRRLSGTVSLHTFMASFPPTRRLVDQIARTVAEMHRNGISHADLTIQNILVDTTVTPSLISIIDFDKAEQKNFLTPETRMRQLRRLDRSLLKWLPENAPWRAPAVRLRFAAAYGRQFPDIRPRMKAYLREFRGYERRYRYGWRLQRLLGVSTKRS